MCGFAVMLTLDGTPARRDVVERMTASLTHRGPDDSGTHFQGPVGLGFRRLSILDLTPTGHQPMSSPDGSVTLVFNGEIYNYAELRTELQALGYRFRSTGDTEVLLTAYIAWGADCLRKLNGMWAFVLYDHRCGKLFGARDRFGVKPLYRYRDGQCVLLASEIKAIRASGLYAPEADWGSVSAFLTGGHLDENAETFYRHIAQVPAAHAFELDAHGTFRQWRYWRVDESGPVASANPAADFADLFEDAMRLHMRSDVPVGVHLSGGLDSTSIICASARLRTAANAADPLMAFCYMSKEHDESNYIDDTLRQTRAHLERLNAGPLQLWDSLGKVIAFQDEPVHSMTALVGFALMQRTAASGLKVILNGQGADESLAGYSSYFKHYWHGLLRSGALIDLTKEIRAFVKGHGGAFTAHMLGQLKYLIQGRLLAMSGYRMRAHRREMDRLRSNRWFTPAIRSNLPEPAMATGAVDLNGALLWSMESTPLPIYLRVEDRNSMAHSVEARVPFLDYRLVSFAYRLPANWKLRGPWNKYLLRESMRGRIPESVRTRVDKMGFPTSAGQWFRDQLYAPMLDLLHSRHARERGIYDIARIVNDLNRHRTGETDVAQELFRVAQLETWFETAFRSSDTAMPGSPGRARPSAYA